MDAIVMIRDWEYYVREFNPTDGVGGTFVCINDISERDKECIKEWTNFTFNPGISSISAYYMVN